ncbi:MAG: virulence RhuM family protein [Bacteroidales bacterium]|nr:virulence RhuM family protein [Bacteroidales bacterium]
MAKELVIEEEGRGGIVLYQSPDGKTNLDVKLENESVWLTQAQMALLFEKDQSVIARHIKNALTEGEIDSSNMQILHNTLSKYKPTTVYNLDVIISVGYRVHSPQGVHFRRWASTVLKDYLIKGYAVKSNIYKERYDDLRALVDTMGRTMQYIEAGDDDQIKSIFDVVRDYTYALDTLDSYDYQTLEVASTSGGEKFHATYDNAMEVISKLKSKFGGSELFGHEKDGSFKSSIGQIYQTWDGKELYPSVEEKAAMLLYLVTKNHSFSDGNKRIAATLFLWFMENNGILYAANGAKRIADNALVALTLMIAESKTDEMDMMVKVVVNLINTRN